TQRQYSTVMKENPSTFSAKGRLAEKVKGINTDSFPVESVSWEQAQLFCKRLSDLPAEKKAGRSYRLPREAEWEYASRANANPKAPYITGSTLTRKSANIIEPSLKDERPTRRGLMRPTAVGSYSPNRWGLYDMDGNVSEWCQDWYRFSYYESSPKRDPKG